MKLAIEVMIDYISTGLKKVKNENDLATIT